LIWAAADGGRHHVAKVADELIEQQARPQRRFGLFRLTPRARPTRRGPPGGLHEAVEPFGPARCEQLIHVGGRYPLMAHREQLLSSDWLSRIDPAARLARIWTASGSTTTPSAAAI